MNINFRIIEQIIRLFAKRSENINVVLELFRNALVTPLPEKRIEALKLIKRISSSTSLFNDFLELVSVDRTFWFVQLECLEECGRCSNVEICIESIRTLNAIVDAFLRLLSSFETTLFSEAFFQRIVASSDEQSCLSNSAIRITKMGNETTREKV